MAKRRTYGNTWWGAAWLEALSSVDEENRLPRGKTYVNQGRIIETRFDEAARTVDALVDGSAYFPYEVELKLPALPKEEARQLLKSIADDPALVAELLEGRLPERVAEICAEHHIALFPKSWRDMRVTCTCPDSAKVCKHVAAVFYAMADAIDADPFLVFRMRGLDLRKRLRELGVNIDTAEVARIPTMSEAREEMLSDEEDPEPFSEDARDDAWRRLRRPELVPRERMLASLLPEKIPDPPPGEPFAEEAKRLFDHAARASENRIFSEENSMRELRRRIEAAAGLSPGRDPSGIVWRMSVRVDGASAAFVEFEADRASLASRRRKAPRAETALGDIAPFLLNVSEDEAEDLPREMRAWRECLLAASRLIRARALIPVPCVAEESDREDGFPRILWLPTLRYADVRAMMQSLAAVVGPILLASLSIDFSAPQKNPLLHSVHLAVSVCACALLAPHLPATLKGRPEESPWLLVGLHPESAPSGMTAPRAVRRTIARLFKPFLLSLSYPWRPIVTVRTHADGIKVNFGLCAKRADGDEAGPLPAGRPTLISKILKEEACEPIRYGALSVLRAIVDAAPELASILESKGKPATLEHETLKTFLLEAAPLLSLLGVAVELPAKLKKILRPRLVGVAEAAVSGTSLLSRGAVAAFDWRVAVGGKILTPEALEALRKRAGEIVRVGDDFVYLDPEEIMRLAEAAERKPSRLEAVRAVLAGEWMGAEVRASSDLKAAIQALSDVKVLPPPEGLRATLRPYQARGYAWLMKNLRLGIGALIADDMGLGKTLQVIAAVTAWKAEGMLKTGKCLAVVPTTLIPNWTREIAKFSPGLTVGVYHGANRALPARPEDFPDVTITSYGLLRRDAERLGAHPWALLILDEAQAVKNASSGQSAAARALGARRTIAMTGTPVENHLMEYWSILDIVQPDLFGSAADFERTFARPIESERDAAAAEAFRRLTAPFMLRRLKSDKAVISDLPEKLSIDRFTTLTPEQGALYQKTLEAALKRLSSADAQKSGKDAAIHRRGQVLALMTALKQICNSPSQYLGKPSARPDSGKAAALLELLDECRAAKRKCLVFTQFRETGLRLQEWIGAATGERPDFLEGSVPAKERQRMVDRFQTDPAARVFIISIRAGGTGLNLTAASAVIHYDLWWNPAVEAQATDRAYRIGQKRDVLVYRFVTAGTFEEKINAMLEAKRELADLAVSTGEGWVGDLSDAELESLFRLSAA